MNFLIDLPILVRLVGLFVIGVIVGGQLNRGIYRLAFYNPRRIGPWSPSEDDAPPRRWFDYLPIVGWFGLRREASLHGTGFWIRPLLIELFTGLGLAALYYYEIELHGLAPVPPAGVEMLHIQFALHAILISLMIVATFIDFDEQTIPDWITVPGTLAAVGLAAAIPLSRLPIVLPPPPAEPMHLHHLVVTSPNDAPQWIGELGGPNSWPLWLDGPYGHGYAVAIFLAWCIALLPKTWTTRYGLFKGFQFLIASIVRPPRKTKKKRRKAAPRSPELFTYVIVGIAAAGTAAITMVWLIGGHWWQSLFSSLVGLAFGGGLIWSVRIIGSHALGREAMGFGDVTLMAMIGAFLGWQPSLIIFFFAPFAALAIAVLQWLLTRRNDIAFGPYLCVATLFLIINWRAIWPRAIQVFDMGWLVPQMVAACLVLMAFMLFGLRLIRQRGETD